MQDVLRRLKMIEEATVRVPLSAKEVRDEIVELIHDIEIELEREERSEKKKYMVYGEGMDGELYWLEVTVTLIVAEINADSYYHFSGREALVIPIPESGKPEDADLRSDAVYSTKSGYTSKVPIDETVKQMTAALYRKKGL